MTEFSIKCILLTILLILIPKVSLCQITFENYNADLYQGILKEPNFDSNLKSKKFVTAIKEECKNGINFGGHYTLVIIGCGTACQNVILVDRKTGNIYDGIVTELGSSFKKNSLLFIKNIESKSYDFDQNGDCDFCKPTYFVWNKNHFEKIKK